MATGVSRCRRGTLRRGVLSPAAAAARPAPGRRPGSRAGSSWRRRGHVARNLRGRPEGTPAKRTGAGTESASWRGTRGERGPSRREQARCKRTTGVIQARNVCVAARTPCRRAAAARWKISQAGRNQMLTGYQAITVPSRVAGIIQETRPRIISAPPRDTRGPVPPTTE